MPVKDGRAPVVSDGRAPVVSDGKDPRAGSLARERGRQRIL